MSEGHERSFLPDVLSRTPKSKKHGPLGQSLVEYALILVLVSLAVAAVLAATGPAIGNVFSNTVFNLLGETTTPYSTIDATNFWDYVTAVASYTPLVPTIVTNTPIGQLNTATPTNTATGTPPSLTPTPTFTLTPTVGPPPTLTDIPNAVPFKDTGDNLSLWSSDGSPTGLSFNDAFAYLPWTVQYYNGSSWPAMGGTAVGTANVCATAPGSPTPCTSDVNYTWGGTSPAPGVDTSGWSAVYQGKAPFEGRTYQVALTVGPNDGAMFKINGAVIMTVSPGQAQPIAPVTVQEPASNPADQTTWYNVEVDYFAGAAFNDKLKLVLGILADEGVCGWYTSPPTHGSSSPPLSWQDSIGNYSVSSNCNLRYRGFIDISATTKPVLSFWDKWTLGPNATASVGVRDYNFTGSNDWVWIPVHAPNAINLGWQQQVFDLTNFLGTNFLATASKKIEIAFRLTNNDPAATADGWYVDDIHVEQNTINVYNVPVSDDMEGGSPLKWIPGCNWAVTTEQSDASADGGTRSWSDSPSSNYLPNSDCSLQLDGVIDLTSYTGTNTAVPQLTFHDKYWINGTTTTLSVEAARVDTPTVWQALTPLSSASPYIAQGAALGTSPSWKLETFNLRGGNGNNALAGFQWYIRFRLVSDSTSPTADGWFIDNIKFADRPFQEVGLPFFEPFNNLDNWTLSGNWGLTTATDGLPHSAPYALTDSPNATQYTVPSTGSQNTAQLTPQIKMSGTIKPQLQFWSHWDTAASANLYLELSMDNGLTWPTVLWQHLYSDTGPAYTLPGFAVGGSYNTNKAWERYTADLSSYSCVTGCPDINLRFRLEAPAGTLPADGLYIDDLQIVDLSNPTYAPPTIAVNSAPFTDGFESGTSNWYVGGNWAQSAASVHTGGQAMSALNPTTVTYDNQADTLLELIPILDLNGATSPVLSFWNKYDINPVSHYVAAEVSLDGANWSPNTATWSDLNWIAPTGSPTALNGTNLGWTRQLMDLSPYMNQKIHMRFRLLALTTDPAAKNWWIDDVYAGPISAIAGYSSYSLPYNENFTNASDLTNNWVAEGDWQTVNDWGPWQPNFPTDNFTPISYKYDGVNPNAQWDVNYYHYYQGDGSFPTAGILPTAQVCTGSSGPQISNFVTLFNSSVGQEAGNNVGFTYSNGVPNSNVSNSQTGVKVGSGDGFKFTANSDTTKRELIVYIGAWNSIGTLTVGTNDGTPQTFYFDSTANNVRFDTVTIDYNSASAGNALAVMYQQTTDYGSGNVKLLAATMTYPGGTSTAAALAVSSASSSGTIDLTAQGTVDWTHWGLNSATDYDHKSPSAPCVKALLHQSDGQVSHTWTSTNVPGGSPGNNAWSTDRLDNEYFTAAFIRQMTVNAGTYHFWASADDGVQFSIDGVLQTPTTGGVYPWTSNSTNSWTPQSATSYFWEIPIAGGTHTFEVDYYQQVGGAALNFSVSEKTNVLHTSSLAANYTAKQDTAVYMNGYVAIPASGTLHTMLSFDERWAIGSSSSAVDPMYVKISTDGGITWTDLTSQLKDVNNNPVQNENNNCGAYGYNLCDAASHIDLLNTYQNWNTHSIDLSAYNGLNITLKFELNASASTNPGSGWYIDNILIKQQ